MNTMHFPRLEVVMYLSRVEIDYDNRKISKELNHLGSFHNWVEQCFPDEFDNNSRSRKLWRIDKIQGKYYLLLLSEKAPDLAKLEMYGKKGSAASKDYKRYLDSLYEGQRLRFRVTLNPIVSRSEDGNNKRGTVYPLIKEVDQLNFLLQRSEKNGFILDTNDYYLLKSEFETLKKKNKQEVKVVKAEFQGELVISDKNKFIETLTKGIGKKKAYGCGLMTVVPVM